MGGLGGSSKTLLTPVIDTARSSKGIGASEEAVILYGRGGGGGDGRPEWFVGNWDASGNTFPATGGTGTSGAILKGNSWRISAAGTLGAIAVIAGDFIIAAADAPGQTFNSWEVLWCGKHINDALTALFDYRGGYNASGNTFPATGGSGVAGAIVVADAWIITVAGTLGTLDVVPGDLLIAKGDNPGQTAANWDVIAAAVPTLQRVTDAGAETTNELAVQTCTIGYITVDNVQKFGFQAALGNTGQQVLAIGTNAAAPNDGAGVTAVGHNAASANEGNDITALGANALEGNTGNFVTAVGAGAGSNNTYNKVILIGGGALATATYQTVLSVGDHTLIINHILEVGSDAKSYLKLNIDGMDKYVLTLDALP